MPAAHHERLSPQDGTFLPWETPASPMHISWLWRFAPGHAPDRAALHAWLAPRLDRLPRLRQRLAFVPIEHDAVWVDDERFDVDAHVRIVAVPAPGDGAALRALAAWILAQPLDRARPLWELTLVDGLDDGGFAALFKVHHCLADGVSTLDIMRTLLAADAPRARRWRPRPAPSAGALLGEQLRWRIDASARLGRDLAGALGRRSRPLGRRRAATARTMAAGITPAPGTPLNVRIGRQRRVDWVSIRMSLVDAIRARSGCTRNDVVLAAVAGAVRTFLARRGVDVDGLRGFRAVVPVSTRGADERGRLGNRASGWVVTLPIDEPDPPARLAAARAATAAAKETDEALGGETLNQLGGLAGAHLRALGVHVLSEWMRPYNLIVSNFGAVPAGLGLCGTPLVAAMPHVPLFQRQGLGVALASHGDHLSFGISGDRDVVPDLADFVADLRAAFDDLSNGGTHP